MPAVVLLRHGAHADVGLRLTGRLEDGGLTEQGAAQARVAAEQLRASVPSAIYASPRRRTRETAQIVAADLALEVQVIHALDEVDFGAFSGKSFDDLAPDQAWQRWNAQRSQVRCPGGETMSEAQARALAFAFEAAARHRSPPLLVTHCDIIRALHCWAERRSLDDIHAISCEPGSLSQLDLSGEQKAAA